MSKHGRHFTAPIALVALLAAAALLAVGCGGGEDGTAGKADDGTARPVAETGGPQVGDLVATAAYVNDASFHEMAEALAKGEMESGYVSTVRGVEAVVGALEWPPALAADVDAFTADLGKLEKALAAMNPKAAARAGEAVHESQHGFSGAVIGALAEAPASADVAGVLGTVNFVAGAGFHEIAEALAEGQLEAYYEDKVGGVADVVAATAWPPSLAAEAEAFQGDLKALKAALADLDRKAAARAGEGVHAAQHDFSAAAVRKLGSLPGGEERTQAVAGITFLDAVGFHDMAEALEHGELEPHYLDQVTSALAVVAAVEWAGELAEPMRQFRSELAQLRAALADQDASGAGTAAEGVHASQHGVSDGLLAVLGAGGGDEGRAAAADGDAVTVEISDWAFERREIEVAEGDVTLRLVNRGEMPHGIFLPDFKVNEKVAAGETREITFHADRTGTFQFVCNDPMCGTSAQHAGMRGKLVVTAG